MFFLLPLTLNLDCKIDKRDYLTIMQGYTYKVEVNMFDNDSPLDLTNAVINIDFMKADKKFIIQTKDITISGNKVSFNTDSDFSNISGKAKIQIIVKKDGFVYGSWVIDVVIKPSAINDNDGQSENKLTITQELKEVIAKAEADIVSIPIEAEKKITELTNQANTSIDTLKTNTQKTLTDLTNQANTSINNVSSNADTKINALITKSNQTIANLEQAIANGDIDSIKNEVFEKEYGTFTTNKSMASVGETTVTAYDITTLEEPMLEEDVTTTLEESTEEENGIMTMEEPMFLADTVVEPIKTGIPKSATLKGHTLVNHLLKCKSNVTSASNVIEFALPMNVAKKYILKFRINSLPTLNESDYRAVKFEWYTGGTTGGYYNHFKQNITIGKDEYVIIPPYTGEVTRTNFSIWSPSYESGTLDIDVAIFEYQDGMENWDIPYFEGMASVVNPSVTSVGKNLLNDDFELGTIGSNNGAEGDSTTAIRTKSYSVVSDSLRYKTWFDIQDYNIAFVCYDKSKNYISTLSNRKIGNAFIFPKGTYYIKVRTANLQTPPQNDVNLNCALYLENEYIAGYEPYKSNTVTTTEEVILRSLPNGVCDTLNLITGEYVQRIEEVVITDNIVGAYYDISKQNDGEGNFLSITLAFDKPVNGYTGLNGGAYCDKFINDNPYTSKVNCVGVYQRQFRMYYNNSTDVQTYKDFLASNPITVQYELATTIVKTVDLTGFPFPYEDGHILLSADSILPTLEYTVATTLKGQGENTAEELLDVKLNKLGKTEKASDSALLNGVKEDTSATGNTIVKRDSYGGAKFKNLTMNNNNSLYGITTGGGTVSLAYLSSTNKTTYGAITNGMLLRSNTQPLLNIAGTEKEILSQHNLPIESGTFTPNIKTITSGVFFTLNEDTFGRYQRIGNKVFVNMRIAWTTKNNAPAGEGVVIGGLPYAPKYSYETLTIGLYHGLGLPSSALELVTHVSSGNGGIVLYYTQSATNWLIYTPQHINNEASIAISGFYTV